MTVDIPNRDARDFWAPFQDLHSGDEQTILMEDMLRIHLVDEADPRVRDWALSNLQKFAWFVDLTDYEDLFRECSSRYDGQCSRFYVINSLVFADRNWKRDFLLRALTQDTDQMGNPSNPVSFDGFSVEIRPSEAIQFVVELGLTELRQEIESTQRKVSRLAGQQFAVDPSDWFAEFFEMVGTSSGNEHPARVLAQRLSEMTPREIVDSVVDEHSPFKYVVMRYQSRLRVLVPREVGVGGESSGVIEDIKILPELMAPIGQSYRLFVTDYSAEMTESEADFHEWDKYIRYYLRGGCDGVNLNEWAFNSEYDEIAARQEGRENRSDSLPYE
jgi:hypothetical protein